MDDCVAQTRVASHRGRVLPILIALCAGLAALALAAGAAASPSFVGLGRLPGDTESRAFGISPDGSVVVGRSGISPANAESSRWTAGSGLVGLGDRPAGLGNGATAVSAGGGVIVGATSRPSGRRAFAYESGVLSELDGGEAIAFGVSDDGSVIVGGGRSASGAGFEAFRWVGGTLQRLGDLPGGAFSSNARDVSSDGNLVVGAGASAASATEAFLWSAQSGTMTGLGFLPGGTVSEAYAISADGGTIVGGATRPFAGTNSQVAEAFLWTATSGMIGLGDLVGGTVFSRAYATSRDGSLVVGTSSTSSGSGSANREAFLWTEADGMRNLRTVLVDDLGVAGLADWQLTDAFAISDDGRAIAGTGLHNGVAEAWYAVIPEPGSAALLGWGLLGLAARQKR